MRRTCPPQRRSDSEATQQFLSFSAVCQSSVSDFHFSDSVFFLSFFSFFPSVNDSHSPTSERQQKEEKMSKSARNDRKKESFFRDVLGSVALVRDCV